MVYKQVNVKTLLFQTTQFSMSTQCSSNWPQDRTLSDATTSRQSTSGTNGNEGVLSIPKSASITATSTSDCLVSFTRRSISIWPIAYRYLTDKMKRSFFQAAVVSILLNGCTTWTLTKRLEKKLDGNYTRLLRAILNMSGHQLYGHLSPITKTIQARRTRHAGHCWRSRDELISDVLLWTSTYDRAKAGRAAMWGYGM